MRKRKTERGGGIGSDKDSGRHNEQERKLEDEEEEDEGTDFSLIEKFFPPVSPFKQMLRQMAVNQQKMGEEEMRQYIRGRGGRT